MDKFINLTDNKFLKLSFSNSEVLIMYYDKQTKQMDFVCFEKINRVQLRDLFFCNNDVNKFVKWCIKYNIMNESECWVMLGVDDEN